MHQLLRSRHVATQIIVRLLKQRLSEPLGNAGIWCQRGGMRADRPWLGFSRSGEEIDDVRPREELCPNNGRRTVSRVDSVDVGSSFNEQADEIQTPVRRCMVQR